MEDDELPEVLGDTYELLEKVGEGGMGTVYRARHRRLDRVVALKFLAESLAAEPDLHGRLEAEGRAMARLDHPYIVAVHDLGRSLGHSYIVMEFVDGKPLSRLLPLPLRQALELADQVCQALAYAHSRGVVHCDVKPQNVLVDAAGPPRCPTSAWRGWWARSPSTTWSAPRASWARGSTWPPRRARARRPMPAWTSTRSASSCTRW